MAMDIYIYVCVCVFALQFHENNFCVLKVKGDWRLKIYVEIVFVLLSF